MNYKVCILAAGIGSRMEPFTQHINKSLLPVDFKAAISHIIEKFDINIEFVVAVGYLKQTVKDYLECAHKERTFKIVEVDKYSEDVEFVSTIIEDLISSPHHRITKLEIERCNRLYKQYKGVVKNG